MSTPSSVEGMREQSFERLFTFLSATDANKKFRFILHPPDMLELKWTVWSNAERRTVGRGSNPTEAVGCAITNTNFYVD